MVKKKFKEGDRVRIKAEVSSKTNCADIPNFEEYMDKYVGKELTFYKYVEEAFDFVTVKELGFTLSAKWLEFVTDEPIVGDWVVAFDEDDEIIAKLEDFSKKEDASRPYLVHGKWYRNAIKWDETSAQLKKIRGGAL